ncbi:MAG: baseplate J/gp47 family protein [Chitinispirillaceae bacterium]|nr:baseplate J/gp47 family protein [Chitinispirillaceae bacterium]
MTATPFLKDFNDLLEARLADLDSEFAGCDQSVGSLCHVLAATNASAEWGLYKYLDWIARQLFPDTCDDELLDRHGNARGIARLPGETRAAYLERILERLRYAPASGNQFDWPIWAKEVSYGHATYTELVRDAFAFEHMRGMGSVNLVITSSRTEAQGGEEEPTSELVAAVTAKIELVRCWGDGDYLVIGATKKTQDVEIDVSGDCDVDKTETDIIAHMKQLNVGKKLYRSQLESIAINNGADDASVTTPSADVAVTTGPTVYERIWPGTITINEV